MKIITLILNKIIGKAHYMNLTKFFTVTFITVNLLIIVVSFILFILQIDCLNENLMTYSSQLNNWLYNYILQDEQDLTHFTKREDLNNNNLNHDFSDSVLNQEFIVDQNKTEAEYSNNHKAEDINDNKDSKTESNNKYKNHYIIGIAISLVVIGILWYYLQATSVNVVDTSDTSSTISSSSDATIVASEASSALSTSSTETLLNQTYSQLYFNITNFRNALESMSYQQLYPYIPNFGNGYNFSIDYQLLNFLRERVEAETLDFNRLFSVLGEAPINIFRNNTNFAIFNTLWQPSDAYPTYLSFVNHICDEYAEFQMLVELGID